MAKRFRTCSLDQPYLLPPSLADWLPEDHLARFVAEVVAALDLSALHAEYARGDGRGRAAYHPELMTRLLLYAYATGQPSSRKIEQATYESIPYRYLAANQHPDHDTIAHFRRRHLAALAALFVQVLRLCRQAGLVHLGHVALDGTKVRANASTHRSVSHARLSEREQHWQGTVEKLLAKAEQADQSEEKRDCAEALPRELACAQTRLAKIRAAKEALEAEARQDLAAAQQAYDEVRRPRGRPRKGEPAPATDPAERQKRRRRCHRAQQKAAQPTRQHNFTDPDSRVMFDNGPKAFVQAYNAQAAVDSAAQVIVAAAVTQEVTDKAQLVPMAQRVRAAVGELADNPHEAVAMPRVLSADTGYWDAASLSEAALEGMDVLVPPAADEPGAEAGPAGAAKQRMRERLVSPAGAAEYGQRRRTVEPVFGQVKQQRGLRQFSLRGLARVDAEWQLICLTHNLRKLCQHRRQVQNAAASAACRPRASVVRKQTAHQLGRPHVAACLARPRHRICCRRWRLFRQTP